MKSLIKRIIGPSATMYIHRLQLGYRVAVFRKISGSGQHECPICGFVGRFMAVGDQPRYNAECPSCGSLERHRLFFLGLQRLNLLSGSERVLHFAAEASLMKTLKKSSASYQTAELLPGHADLALNIEQINLPDKSMDVVIANHVLEHVNDKAALRELRRVLSDSGRLFITIPLIEGWAKTYEDPAITSEAERTKHFGQRDHVRYFGRDFRDRVLAAGFTMTEFGCDGADAVKYSLPRGETLFICTKTKSE